MNKVILNIQKFRDLNSTGKVNYKDFLQLPEIRQAFNEMFEERKIYFRDKSLNNTGLNKESLEAMCIKMSFIATDLYFTQIHKTKYRT